jgi:hypothetical protein
LDRDRDIVLPEGLLVLREPVAAVNRAGSLRCRRRRLWRKARAVHDPGKILLDVALAAALGGDCLADSGMLRSEPSLLSEPLSVFGSEEVVWRSPQALGLSSSTISAGPVGGSAGRVVSGR